MRVSGVGCWVLGLLTLPLLTTSGYGQRGEGILLVNQVLGAKPSSIDLTDYLSRELSQVPGYAPLVYKARLQSVKDAIASGALSAEETTEPLSAESARKVARALGFRQVLRVSGQSTPEGVGAHAELERLSGQQSWGVVFLQKLEPYKGRGSKPTLLEGIKAQVALIVQRVTGAPVQVQVQDPIAIKTGPKEKSAPKSGTKEAASPPAPAANPSTPNPQTAPPLGPSYELIADRYRREGDQANLILALRKAVNEKPREARLRRELVQAYLDRGWHAQARDEAQRAVSLTPEDASLRRLLGDAALRSGDTASALKELEEAVRRNPKDVETLVAIGDVHIAAARLEEAERSYAAAVEADPKHPLPHRRIARIQVDRGQYADAQKSVAAARVAYKDGEADALQPDYVSYFNLLESALGEVLTRIHSNRQSVAEGSRTREQAFTFGVAQRKRAESIAGFLDDLAPIPSLQQVQRLYAQAAGFVIQAAESALLTIEAPDTRREQEAGLLRLEATRALAEASKRLKAITTR